MHNYVALTKTKMRTKSQDKTTAISFKNKLQDLGIADIVKSTGFEQRQAKKINGLNLILSFFGCCAGNSFSLSLWALSLGEMTRETVSKQAISARLNDSFVKVVFELLNKCFAECVNQKGKMVLERFKNVYLHDSSCISLPDSLKDVFKGNFSRGEIKAIAKLQIVFNLNRGSLKSFELGCFSKNDQAAAKDILPFLKKGDLVLRDLGYFVINVLHSINVKGADFISRLRTDVNIYECKTGKQICLKSLLKNKTFVKKKVLIGSKEKMKVTLMAIKTSDDIKQFRKLKAFQDRDKRKVVTIEKLKLLGWDIFVSSVEDLTGQEIKDIYRLRWQIEILFKAWKSHLRIERNMSPHLKNPQLPTAIIYLSLLVVVLLIMPVYAIYLCAKKKTITKKISLLKLTKLLAMKLSNENCEMNTYTIENITYHSRYEKRARDNFEDKFSKLT